MAVVQALQCGRPKRKASGGADGFTDADVESTSSNDDEIDREARIIVADGLTTFGVDFGLGMNIAAFAGLRAGAVIENTLSQDETMALQAMAGVSLSFSFGGSAGPFSLAYRAAEGCQK